MTMALSCQFQSQTWEYCVTVSSQCLDQKLAFLRVSQCVFAGAAINAFMALLNLIPIGVLDGLKVFRWNKSVWLVLFALSGLVTALSYWSL